MEGRPKRKRRLSASSRSSGASSKKFEKSMDEDCNISLDDTSAQLLKQSFSSYLLEELKNFRFTEFHPECSLEEVYQEHQFFEYNLSAPTDDLKSAFGEPDERMPISQIVDSIDIHSRGEKLLLWGKRGCGFSTFFLRTCAEQSLKSEFDFILLLNETNFSVSIREGGACYFTVCFGAQSVDFFDFCSKYGKFSLVFLDNTEFFDAQSIKQLLGNELLESTTVICGFQSQKPPSGYADVISRCYRSYGFCSSSLKSIAISMMGSYWSESLYSAILRKCLVEDDLSALSIFSGVMHRNFRLNNDTSLIDCFENFIRHSIIKSLKKSGRRSLTPPADEVSSTMSNLTETAYNHLVLNRKFSDQSTLNCYSSRLRIYLVARCLATKSEADVSADLDKIREASCMWDVLELLEVAGSSKLVDLIQGSQLDRRMILSSCLVLEDRIARKAFNPKHSIIIELKRFEALLASGAESNKSSLNDLRTPVKSFAFRASSATETTIALLLTDVLKADRVIISYYSSCGADQGSSLQTLLQGFSQLFFETLTISDIRGRQLLKTLNTGVVCREMGLRNMEVAFSQASTILELANFARNCKRFTLTSVIMSTDAGLSGSSGLFFLLLLLTNETAGKAVERLLEMCQLATIFSKNRVSEIEHLSVNSKNGLPHSLEIDSVLVFSDCDSTLKFFESLTKFDMSLTTVDVSSLEVVCRTRGCFQCSSLLFIIPATASRNSKLLFKHDCTLSFTGQKFTVAQLDFALQQISLDRVSEKNLRVDLEDSGVSRNKLSTHSRKIMEELGTKGTQLCLELDDEVSRKCSSTSPEPESDPVRLIEVEVDPSGWAFYRFELDASPLTLCFSNGVSVCWEKDSTDGPRVVAVEVHTIPTWLTHQVCSEKKVPTCVLSPFVFIDYKPDIPFLKPVTVSMPHPELSNSEGVRTKVFADYEPFTKRWNEVTDGEKVKFSSGSFTYSSKTFSPLGAVSCRDSSPINPTDFWEKYLPESVYMIVCPSQYDTKIIFDCRKFRDEEEHKSLKLTAGARFRKLNSMCSSERIYAEIKGNLAIDESYGYSLRDDKKLVFYYPDPEHESNQQEYKMKIISRTKDPEGTITYYKQYCSEINEELKLEKLFHLKLELQFTPVGMERPGYKRKASAALGASPKKQMSSSTSNGRLILNNDAIKKTLKTLRGSWPVLLRRLEIEERDIFRTRDHDLGDTLRQIKVVVDEDHCRDFIRTLFSDTGTLDLEDTEALIDNEYKKNVDKKEAFMACCTAWLKRADNRSRTRQNVIKATEKVSQRLHSQMSEEISEGAAAAASKLIIRQIDRTSEQEILRKIIEVLKEENCKDYAIALLMKMNGF